MRSLSQCYSWKLDFQFFCKMMLSHLNKIPFLLKCRYAVLATVICLLDSVMNVPFSGESSPASEMQQLLTYVFYLTLLTHLSVSSTKFRASRHMFFPLYHAYWLTNNYYASVPGKLRWLYESSSSHVAPFKLISLCLLT